MFRERKNRASLHGYGPWRVRTADLLLRRETLYPAELKDHQIDYIVFLLIVSTVQVFFSFVTILIRIVGEVRKMKVSQRMTINPITVTPEDNIYSVKDIMDREGIHRLPVLDSKGTLVGLISKSDILAASPDFSSSPSIHEVAYLLSRLTVSDVMSTEVMTISPDATVEQAARVMIDGEISCLPVIDNGVLVGLITRTDLFRLLIELLGARHYGVSASFTVKDEPGKLAEITSKLASCEADIVSIGTMRSFSDVGSVTMKVQGISCEDLSDILTPMVIEVQDIREE